MDVCRRAPGLAKMAKRDEQRKRNMKKRDRLNGQFSTLISHTDHSGASAMSNLIVLEGVELIPVLELEPCKFATQTRTSPSGTFWDVPDDWFRYWTDSLAD